MKKYYLQNNVLRRGTGALDQGMKSKSINGIEPPKPT